ncbi:MAG: hypothetical protein JKX97_06785 [Candidatus Lindowbacteria bacterium]|nr:hypothetical protein [Candidatus Lindowbacteria bacterium]
MKLYEFSELKPGMKTAAPVFGRDRLLLNSNVELTMETIMKLPMWGVFYIFVDENNERISGAA